MTPLQTLKAAVAVFEEEKCRYCLIGGHAASLYRASERLTRDVDFALVAEGKESASTVAKRCIFKLGLKPMIGVVPQGTQSAEGSPGGPSFICSAATDDKLKGILDILLPELPWVKNAVQRAQANRVNLGFAAVPVITPEDLIISKCYSFRGSPDRFQDLDDLKELLQYEPLDVDYLRSQLSKLSLVVPQLVTHFFPGQE